MHEEMTKIPLPGRLRAAPSALASAASWLAFLAPEEAKADGIMAIIADGKPWAVETMEGGRGSMTFFADGTGHMRAELISVRMTWMPMGNGFCLTGGPMRARCVTLRAWSRGYVGIEDGQETLRLSR